MSKKKSKKEDKNVIIDSKSGMPAYRLQLRSTTGQDEETGWHRSGDPKTLIMATKDWHEWPLDLGQKQLGISICDDIYPLGDMWEVGRYIDAGCYCLQTAEIFKARIELNTIYMNEKRRFELRIQKFFIESSLKVTES